LRSQRRDLPTPLAQLHGDVISLFWHIGLAGRDGLRGWQLTAELGLTPSAAIACTRLLMSGALPNGS